MGIVDDGSKLPAHAGRKRSFGSAIYQGVVVEPVLDQIGDGHDFELVLARELHEIRLASHRAVILHNLTDDPGRLEARESSEIHRPFSLTRPDQDTAVSCT